MADRRRGVVGGGAGTARATGRAKAALVAGRAADPAGGGDGRRADLPAVEPTGGRGGQFGGGRRDCRLPPGANVGRPARPGTAGGPDFRPGCALDKYPKRAVRSGTVV